MNINPNTILSLAFGTLGLYIATNKQPPEWLLLTSLFVGVVGITRDAVALTDEAGMAGMPRKCCGKCYNADVKKLSQFTYK